MADHATRRNASPAEAGDQANGHVVAAFLAAAISMLTLGIVQVRTFLDKDFQEWVFGLGKAWIPNAEGIGPYSGKETIMLVVWLVSWLVLDLALRKRTMDTRLWFGVAMVGMFVAVLLIWPPVWHWIE